MHVGNSATSGHYTAFVKQPGNSNKWCHMDDSHVDTVSESTVLKQKNAYVLFYTRKEVKLEFPPPPSREELVERKSKSLSPSNKISTSSREKGRSSKVKHQRRSLDSSRKMHKQREAWKPSEDMFAQKEMDHVAKARKNKMRLGYWDSLIDEAKLPKKKRKSLPY